MGLEVFENYECEGQISLDNIEESENDSESKQASKQASQDECIVYLSKAEHSRMNLKS